jgi:hypothetical protein
MLKHPRLRCKDTCRHPDCDCEHSLTIVFQLIVDTDVIRSNLELPRVMVHIVRPDGGWYFQGPSGEGGDPRGFHIDASRYPPCE